jgi:transcriptional regulator with XRE-family HTH domain
MTEQAKKPATALALALDRWHYNQSQLAKMLGLSRSAVSLLVAGQTRPSKSTASKIIEISQQKDDPKVRLTYGDLYAPELPGEDIAPPTEPEDDKAERGRLSVVLEVSVVERLRNAAFWTPGMTLAKLVQQGLEEYARRLEAAPAHLPDPDTGKVITKGAGEPFPTRTAPLPVGRR